MGGCLGAEWAWVVVCAGGGGPPGLTNQAGSSMQLKQGMTWPTIFNTPPTQPTTQAHSHALWNPGRHLARHPATLQQPQNCGNHTLIH